METQTHSYEVLGVLERGTSWEVRGLVCGVRSARPLCDIK